MDDELHSAALVEETLEDHAPWRRHRAEHLPPGFRVLRDLSRRAFG